MTVIAYKDGVLAADRLGDRGGTSCIVTKIRKTKDDKAIMAASGCADINAAMFHWYDSGADPDTFPELQTGSDSGNFVVVSYEGVFVYDRTAYPVQIHDRIMAWGSGGDYAISAMHLGLSAIEAVLHTNNLSCYCGNGVQSYRVDSLDGVPS